MPLITIDRTPTLSRLPLADARADQPPCTSAEGSSKTGPSDPKTWFDHLNGNPAATFASNIMDGTFLHGYDGRRIAVLSVRHGSVYFM